MSQANVLPAYRLDVLTPATLFGFFDDLDKPDAPTYTNQEDIQRLCWKFIHLVSTVLVRHTHLCAERQEHMEIQLDVLLGLCMAGDRENAEGVREVLRKEDREFRFNSTADALIWMVLREIWNVYDPIAIARDISMHYVDIADNYEGFLPDPGDDEATDDVVDQALFKLFLEARQCLGL